MRDGYDVIRYVLAMMGSAILFILVVAAAGGCDIDSYQIDACGRACVKSVVKHVDHDTCKCWPTVPDAGTR